MKITKEIWSLGALEQVRHFRDVEHAFSDSDTDLREAFGRLLECIYGESSYRLSKANQVSYILGTGYEAEE